MAKLSREVLVFVPLIIGEASGLYAGFCPSWMTVSSKFFHEQDGVEGNKRRIRMGEVAASIIVVATGLAISYETKSGVPFWTSVVTGAIFVGGYEYMMAHPSTEDSSDYPPGVTPALKWRFAR